MKKFDLQLFADAQGAALETTDTQAQDATGLDTAVNQYEGLVKEDLLKLKADEQKTIADIDAALEAIEKEKWAAIKTKIGAAVQFTREKVLPWLQTAAVAYVVLKVTGVL